MTTIRETTVQITRTTLTTDRAYDDALAAVQAGLGHAPDISALLVQGAALPGRPEFDALFNDVAGTSGLIEFMTLELGAALAVRAPEHRRRMVRIIAGNPVTMSTMAATTPDVGSYAPISILVVERPSGVTLSYDSLASALAPYDDQAATAVARQLDDAVITLLVAAAG